ncbi:MAG: hypothetical protein J7647_04085, partial [Cyanobacteria bacterium SBLK]|nr:hypothetical protein [Cyanobacteria bacterium SBLK]
MKLSTLKAETYDAWECISTFNDAVVQPEHFKTEVRAFGDLRCKETWKKAYCSFWAQNIYDSCLDAYNLIRIYFNPSPDDWDYELRYRIFEEFLKFPDGLELIKLGLEQLFSANFTSQERKKADGFFELVQGQSEGGEEFGGAVSSIRRFAELAGTS